MEVNRQVKWSFRASLELIEIQQWLTEQVSERYAEEYINGIWEKVAILSSMPNRYGFCRSQKLQQYQIRCVN